MGIGRLLGRAVAASALVGLLAVPGVVSSQPLPTRQAAEPGARPAECGGALEERGPITIATDADFTPGNGVRGGSGTPTDPFVISCWTIAVPAGGNGISVAAGTIASFVIRNVAMTGSGPADGARGINIARAAGAVVIDHVTATTLLVGIATHTVGSAATPLQITNSSVLSNSHGIQETSSVDVVIKGNLGVDNLTRCINRNSGSSGETQPRVESNTCRGGGGEAFWLSGNGTQASNNTAEGDRAGTGFAAQGSAVLRDNVARNFQTGFFINGIGITAERNLAESNIIGFDITVATQSLLKDNTAIHNGSTGFQAFAIQNVVPSARNRLEGNKIGWNPFGIALLYMNNANEVHNTEWLDGHPAFIRFADQNTIVDAGSTYRGLPGQPTRFHDWIAVARVGNADPPAGTTRFPDLTAVTGGTWEFGDGESMPLTPEQLQGLPDVIPPDVTHAYAAPGEYTAKLTVNATGPAGPVTFTDTTKVTIADSADAGLLPVPAGHEPWPSLANDPARTFFNGAETTITPGNVAALDVKWRFPTTEPVTATPAVATIDIGDTPTEAVFAGSYSGTMYAVRASNGAPLWVNCLIEGGPEPFCDPQAPNDPDRQQAYGAIVDSPAVAKVALPGGVSEDRVFVGVGGANAHMVALNANTGDERWRFTAADSAPSYSISGSPVVVGDTVYFGMDCNNRCDFGGGIFALDVVTGNLRWFWDVHSGANFVAPPGTMTFDPKLMRGNPAQAISRDCGAVWSSPAIDVELGLAFVGTADCLDVPMADHEEAVVALDLTTGAPVWRFQPRQIDQRDMDFGATPNVFKIGDRHVVGAAGKDGVYYALDAQSGDEIWSTKLALGGNFGGFYGTATDGERIYLTNAIGEATDFFVAHEERPRGTEWALDARTGNVEWVQHLGSPSVGHNTASGCSLTPECDTASIYWTGGLDHQLHAWNADDGQLLGTWNVGGAASSAPAIADGHVYVGAGTGATYRAAVGDSDPLGASTITFPHPIPVSEYGQGIYSFCLTSEPDCAESRNDPESAKRGVVVTYDGTTAGGDYHDPVTVSATLQEALAPPLGGRIEGATLTFAVGGESCTGTTGADGKATCTLTPDAQPGGNTIKTSYAGDATRRAADDFDGFIVTKEQTALAYTGKVNLTDSESVGLGAKLTEDDGTPVSGGEVTLTIGTGGSAQSCTATTGGGGVADCNVDLDQPVGAATVVADFAGDDFYHPVQLSTPVTVAVPATGGQGPGPGPGDKCPAEKSSAQLGAEPPAAGGAAAGATLGFPFVSRRFGRSRARGRGRGALLPLTLTGAVMALTLAGCGFFGGPSPTPGC